MRVYNKTQLKILIKIIYKLFKKINLYIAEL